VCLASALFVCGCQQQAETPEVSRVASIEQNQVSSNGIVSPSSEVVQRIPSRPMLIVPDEATVREAELENTSLGQGMTDLSVFEAEPVVEALEPIDPADKAEAARLFAALLSPETDAAQWEQTHSELLSQGPAAAVLLGERLNDGADFERETAASLLVLLGSDAKRAVPDLTGALSDSSDFVRANAAAALVQFPESSSQAIPVLVGMLKDIDPQLRQMAAMNLSAVGTEATPHVRDLTEVLAKEQDAQVIVPVVQLLGRLGPEANAAVPQLQQVAFQHGGQVQTEVTAAIGQIQSVVQ